MAVRNASNGTRSRDVVGWRDAALVGVKQGGVIIADPTPPPAPDPDPPEEPPTSTPPPVPFFYGNSAAVNTLADGFAVHADSADIIDQMVDNMASFRPRLSITTDTPTVYVVDSDDPTYDIDGTALGGSFTFKCPSSAVNGTGGTGNGGSANNDFPMVLMDPDNASGHGAKRELRLWRASINHSARVITAQGGGLYDYSENGDGTPEAGTGTGSGLSYAYGLITTGDWLSGEIRHGLRISYSACHQRNSFVAPATKTDQPHPSVNCSAYSGVTTARKAQMGMCLRLNSSVDCDARTIAGYANDSPETRLLRMICHAAQDYGIYILDGTSAGNWCMYAEANASAGWTTTHGMDAPFGSLSYIIRDQETGGGSGATRGLPFRELEVVTFS